MLIIPVEQKPNWRRPPVVTLLLILANCLIFFLYQLSDYDRIDQTVEAYKESGLYQQERDLYMRHIRFEPYLKADLMESLREGDDESVMVNLLHDLSFEQALRERPGFEGSEWESKRQAVEEQRNTISYVGYGYKPSDPSFIDAFVSMFLHGGFGHLFGNMLFLFIFGFGLEASLGWRNYLGIYLVSGFGATGLYQLIDWDSFSFGVGASGAISGLMGAYLAVYGMKRIRFFMTLGFYFNNFTAPAIMILPFWLGKEILNGLFGGDNVNQWAHAGGLISGFALVYAMKLKGWKIEETALTDEAPEEQETPYQRDTKQLESYMNSMQLFKAIDLCQKLLKKYPGDKAILQSAWSLFEGLPDHAAYQSVVKSILQLPADEGDRVMVERVYSSYRKTTGKMPESEEVCLVLLERFINTSWRDHCVELTDKLTAARCKNPRLALLVKTLGHQLRNTDIEKSRFLKAYAQKFFPTETVVLKKEPEAEAV